MVKYIDTHTNKEYKIGDAITIKKYKETAFTSYCKIEKTYLSAELAEECVKRGLLKKVEEKEEPIDIYKIISEYLSVAGIADVKDFITKLGAVDGISLQTLVLRAVAKYIDKKYTDYILDAPELWFIARNTLEAIKYKHQRTKWLTRSVALFRTKEDAEKALKATISYLASLCNEQKDKKC